MSLALVGQEAPWIQTAAYNRGRARDLHAKMLALNTDLGERAAEHRIDPNGSRWKAWKGFINGFGQWMESVSKNPVIPVPGLLAEETSWGMSATGATLDRYTNELRNWYSWYNRAFRRTPSAFTPAEPPKGPSLPALPTSIPLWGYLALGGLGIFALAKLVRG